MELKLDIKQNPGTITLNFEEIEKAVDERLAEYKGAVFTEDAKDIAKKELASLRKFKKDFESVRKAAKNQWMEPYMEFEAQVKKLTAKIDEPIALIDSQVKEFEATRKAERRALIMNAYEELIGDIAEYTPLEKIWRSQWENASVSMKAVKKEMADLISAAQAAVTALSTMQSDAAPEALGVFRDSQDITKAIAYIQDYEARKKRILEIEAERKRKEAEAEEARRRAEEVRLEAEKQRLEAEKQRMAERVAELEAATAAIVDPVGDEDLPFETPTTQTVFYRIVATGEEIEQIDTILNSIGVFWERRSE